MPKTLRAERANRPRQAYGAEGACPYLVRPDGYVGFRSPIADGIRERR
jgi:hypothetical protein